jgi:hypothetical protein
MKKIAVAALLSLTAVLPATAADMYVGLKLGSAKHDISVSGYTETVGAAGILIGYKFNPNIAIEGEATNLGSLFNSSYPVTAVSVSLVGSANISEQVSLFGKLGGAATRESNSSGTQASNKSAATIGFGGQFNVNPTLSLRFGWDRYTYGGTNGYYEGTAGMTSVAALINF